MLEGADVPRSHAWWIKTLAGKLQDRRLGRSGGRTWTRATAQPTRIRPGLDLLWDYRCGEPPLQSCAQGWDEHLREVQRVCDLNFAAKIASAKGTRMRLRGFRTAAENDELGDQVVHSLMKAAEVKVVAREVHDFVLTMGDGYTITTPPGPNEKYPSITAEDPREAITAHDPVTRRIIAGLKLFRDEWDAADFAYLFVRNDNGTVTKRVAINRGHTSLTRSGFRMMGSWEWYESAEAGDDTLVPHDRMPMARMRNRNGGRGEYELHLGTLDRINMQILDRVVISKLQAFRQRAIKGLPETEKKIVDGKVVEVEVDYTDVFQASPGALWQVPDTVEFWESQVVDLGPLRLAIKDDLIALAASTDTSLPSVTPDAATGSAEGASLMREDQTFAIEACIDHVDSGWVQTMSNALAFFGDLDRAAMSELESIWAPAERFSLTERADAASKAGSSLPQKAVQRDIWQYEPREVQELQALRGADLLYSAQRNQTASGGGLAPLFMPAPNTGATSGDEPATD